MLMSVHQCEDVVYHAVIRCAHALWTCNVKCRFWLHALSRGARHNQTSHQPQPMSRMKVAIAVVDNVHVPHLLVIWLFFCGTGNHSFYPSWVLRVATPSFPISGCTERLVYHPRPSLNILNNQNVLRLCTPWRS